MEVRVNYGNCRTQQFEALKMGRNRIILYIIIEFNFYTNQPLNCYFWKFIFSNVLDIEKACIKGAEIITFPFHGGPNQRWYIKTDGTISSEGDTLVLDVKDNNIRSGAKLIAWPRNEPASNNQIFEFASM